MSFRIDRREPLGDQFQSALTGQLQRAIRELGQSSPASQAAAVHGARKRIKRVRAVLRLLRKVSPRADAWHTPLRAAAWELASMRDARIDEATLEKISGECSILPSRIAGIMEFLKQRRSGALANASEAMHKAVLLLASVRSVIGKSRRAHLDRRDLCEAVAALYKRDRASFRKAEEERSAVNLHRCRKRTNDVWLILMLLKPAGSKARKFEEQARRLCSLLGKEHDLAHLRETLDEGATGVQRDVIGECIAARRHNLQRKVMKLGAKFFAHKPKDFAGKCVD